MRTKLYLNTYEPQAPKIATEQCLGLEVEKYLQPMTEGQLEQNQIAVSNMIAGVARLIMHGPLISTDLEQLALSDAADVRRIYQQSFRLAAGHGINRLVFHSGFVPNRHVPAHWLEQSVGFWRSFLSELPSTAIIYVENMVDDDPRLLCQLHDQVADTRLKLCLDLGHANCNSSVSLSNWVAQLGGRIGHVHLHNNDGLADRHWTLSRGDINIESVLSDLARFAPEASYTLECDSVSSLNWLAERGYL